jgi:uncharacterized protein YacL (UPF0231 family)
MNHDVKKKYITIEIINKINKINEIINIIGMDKKSITIIFHVGYSSTFFLEIIESKNRNNKKAKSGKKMISPTIGKK